MKRVMVFGTFDGLHAGHRSLLREARTYGDYLIVVVARDEVVQQLKKHKPKYFLAQRMEHLKKEDGVDEAVASDAVIGSWEVVKKHKPEVIACGYDQQELKIDLEKHLVDFGYAPKIVVLKPFEPEKHHSSVLNQ